MEKFLVLWLDDEHDSPYLSDLKVGLRNRNIDLECYKSSNSALSAIQANPNKYDALLCDIRIQKDDSDPAVSNKFMFDFFSGLDELNVMFDPIMLTGQAEEDRTDLAIMLYFLKGKTVLKKDHPEIVDQVAAAVQSKAENNYKYIAKRKFPFVHKLLHSGFLTDKALNPFHDYCESEFFKNKSEPFNKKNLNALRQTLEILYNQLALANILPKEIYQNPNDGGNALSFLKGLDVAFKDGSRAIVRLNDSFHVNKNVSNWLSQHFYTTSLASHAADDAYGLRELEELVGTDLSSASAGTLYFFEEIAQYFNYWIRKLTESDEFKSQTFYTRITIAEASPTLEEVNIIATITNINGAGNGFARAEDQVDYYIPSNIITPQLKRGVKINITRIEPKTGDLNSKVLTYHIINA